MNHRIFVVFDSKASAYLPPFFMPEAGQAVRVFSDMCNDSGHAFGKHPEDYTLFEIGTFDDRAGTLLMLKASITHGVGLAFLGSSLGAADEQRVLNLVDKESAS